MQFSAGEPIINGNNMLKFTGKTKDCDKAKKRMT
jgi:hypothetical protein